ncbi:acyl-CoA dehydrogenase family protein [Burkholderia sp. F1]|uniref:acyl-CoA dehydrogenase family protein n=1 Tax=Burkholderia sp. F1 TaxID=3366817 RepID=UPI003D72DE72
MSIDADDVAALLSEVEVFARQRIAREAERPETPIDDMTLNMLTAEAAALGMIPGQTDDAGFALWEQVDEAPAMRFNLGLLRILGQANAGVAFAWHRRALARALGARIGVFADAGASIVALSPTGHYGLGLGSCGRWLSRAETDADAEAMRDWLNHDEHASTVIAPPQWDTLVWPVWRDGQVAWQVLPRFEVEAHRCRAQHGFDELAAYACHVAHEQAQSEAIAPEHSRELYAWVLKVDMMGLLAIGTGAAMRSRQLAVDYAHMRRQGGKLIGEHAAVQAMLADIDAAVRQGACVLARFERSVDAIDLTEVAALRMATQPLFCRGANQAVQVFGGIGYMRDAGPEKLVRDQNMLKLQCGGIREIPLLLAALNGGLA